jgi:hypothetical protein
MAVKPISTMVMGAWSKQAYFVLFFLPCLLKALMIPAGHRHQES